MNNIRRINSKTNEHFCCKTKPIKYQAYLEQAGGEGNVSGGQLDWRVVFLFVKLPIFNLKATIIVSTG